MPNHIHVIWEWFKLNGKEKPPASFNRKIAHFILKDLKSTSKTSILEFKVAFFSETRRQKRSLAALNKYFDKEVSGKKIISKIESGFLEVP